MASKLSNGMSRSRAREAGLELARNYPKEMQGALADVIPEYVEALKHDMRDNGTSTENGGWQYNPAHRTAMQLVPQILGVIGSGVTLAINVWQSTGAESQEHAEQLIRNALDAEGMDLEQAWRLSEQFVQEYRRTHGLPELVESTRRIVATEVVE